jgi:hypothetical protein
MRCARGNKRKKKFTGCVRARRSQRGCLSGGGTSWGPGGARRAVRWQLAAGENAGDGRWAALQRNREGKQEEEDQDLFINFAKVLGVYCKVKFSSKL